MEVPGQILFNIQVHLQNKLAIESHSHDLPQAPSKSDSSRGKSGADPALNS